MSTSNKRVARLAISPGEPAGVGPELIVQLAASAPPQDCEWLLFADPDLLADRAEALGLALPLDIVTLEDPPQAGRIGVYPIALGCDAEAGVLNTDNADYVLHCLETATDACIAGQCQALVTAPVQKSVINDAGIPFSGHTEFLAERCCVERVVMMLATPSLRVALQTTHMPLKDVPAAITESALRQTLDITQRAMQQQFGIAQPRITVLGLNPHAGEGGHMGREEIDTIIPCLQQLNNEGMKLRGPLPADTAFNPEQLQYCDAVLAMYHDQGLPVLKSQGFGEAVNITLGLPIIRTSVDHGTALDLAGTGKASASSLQAAVDMALSMIHASDSTRSGPENTESPA